MAECESGSTHSVFQSLRVADVTVCSGRADIAEHDVTRLAEQQLLLRVGRAFGDDFAPLPGHQVQQLVHEKRGGQIANPSSRQGNLFPTDWTPEMPQFPHAGQCGDFFQTGAAHGVGAVQQFGIVVTRIVRAQARAEKKKKGHYRIHAGRRTCRCKPQNRPAREKALSEVLVIDGHRLHQCRRRHPHFARQRLRPVRVQSASPVRGRRNRRR